MVSAENVPQSAENDAPLFTPDELTQWRADAGYINTHTGLFLPETSTMAWRFLALLQRVRAVEALAAEWATHTEDPRAYAAARILDTLGTRVTPPERTEP